MSRLWVGPWFIRRWSHAYAACLAGIGCLVAACYAGFAEPSARIPNARSGAPGVHGALVRPSVGALVDAACLDVDTADRVDWSTPVPEGDFSIAAVRTGADGCLAVALASQGHVAAVEWFLCIDEDAMPFRTGDRVAIQHVFGLGYEAVDLREQAGGESAQEVERRLVASRGARPPAFGDVEFDLESGRVGSATYGTARPDARTGVATLVGGGGQLQVRAFAPPPVRDDRASACASGPGPAGSELEIVLTRRPLHERPAVDLPSAAARARPTAGGNREPVSLAIAVDVSASMRGASLRAVQIGLRALGDQLGPDDEVTIVAFSDRARVLATAARAGSPELERAIGGLFASGQTNLYAGLRTALESVASPSTRNRRRQVILLSDGRATTGLIRDARLLGIARAHGELGTQVSTIGLGERFDPMLLRRVSAVTGGEFDVLVEGRGFGDVFVEQALDAALTISPRHGETMAAM